MKATVEIAPVNLLQKSLDCVLYVLYSAGMERTHSQIITSGEGAAAFARALGEDPNKVYQWRRNDSIPQPYWQQIKELGLASYEELAAAAALKRQPPNAAA